MWEEQAKTKMQTNDNVKPIVYSVLLVLAPTRKERPLGVELRGDAAHGPDVDGRRVVGRPQQHLGRAVPASTIFTQPRTPEGYKLREHL